ncbi:HPr family phosphocarrier protein [Hellea balneolensis]|uniref:HPr family phosphocarrier protein n=1 Tax=Hellea balneolensis TaxID=287478 RepID=UPI0004239CF3|nr:HPr family phosphocarrier protein [Hellea balneolensis]
MSNTATATVRLINKRGLHARASNKFMECVMRFDAQVLVRSHNDVCAETVVADSVMELLLLGSACGEEITISATGQEAEPAISALVDLVEGRFGESE